MAGCQAAQQLVVQVQEAHFTAQLRQISSIDARAFEVAQHKSQHLLLTVD